MQPVTPRGFRDVLPQEAAERGALARSLADVFESWDYGLVETPVVEVHSVLEAGAGPGFKGTAFRLFDSDGRLLALRPEMTVPIARLAAARLRDEPLPLRLRYTADVFREHASLRGQSRQFTQAGVELVGAAGPAADAEVITILAEAIDATGLPRYTIALGTVAVLRALLDASGADESWRAAVLTAAHDRNLVEIERLAERAGIDPEVAAAIRTVPRIQGGREAIDECRAVAATCGCAGVLDDLAEVWTLLESTGAAARVTVDFGTMRAFDYYTGVVFEVLAPGLGLPVGGGGRYDAVLSAFGRPAPAAGFALGIERLHIACAEQDVRTAVGGCDAVVGGGDAVRVFAGAQRMRAAGWRVRVAPGADGPAVLSEARAAGAHEALIAEGDDLVRIDRSGERAEPLGDPLPAPPARGGEAR